MEMPLSIQQEERLRHIELGLSEAQKEVAGVSTAIKYIGDNIKSGFEVVDEKLDKIQATQDQNKLEVTVLKDDVKDIKKDRDKDALRWNQLKAYLIPLLAGGIGLVAQKLGSLIIAAIATP